MIREFFSPRMMGTLVVSFIVFFSLISFLQYAENGLILRVLKVVRKPILAGVLALALALSMFTFIVLLP